MFYWSLINDVVMALLLLHVPEGRESCSQQPFYYCYYITIIINIGGGSLEKRAEEVLKSFYYR